jgi:hypothetical protein
MITKFNDFSNNILEFKNNGDDYMKADKIKKFIIDNYKDKVITSQSDLDNIIATIINTFDLYDKSENAIKSLLLNYIDYKIQENFAKDEDYLRPMYNNIPDDNNSYDPLITGNFISFGNITGQIHNIDNEKGIICIDVINKDNKHEHVKFKIKDVIKSIKKKKGEK